MSDLQEVQEFYEDLHRSAAEVQRMYNEERGDLIDVVHALLKIHLRQRTRKVLRELSRRASRRITTRHASEGRIDLDVVVQESVLYAFYLLGKSEGQAQDLSASDARDRLLQHAHDYMMRPKNDKITEGKWP